MNIDEMNRRGLGERIFSFAVITDTHTNEDEEVCSSPFPVNRLANGRTRYVFNALNGHDLSFVIHVGDIIHPVPSMSERYERAAALFHKSARALRHDLFLVPGNHDIGDKPNDWAPAGVIQEGIPGAMGTQLRYRLLCLRPLWMPFYHHQCASD